MHPLTGSAIDPRRTPMKEPKAKKKRKPSRWMTIKIAVGDEHGPHLQHRDPKLRTR